MVRGGGVVENRSFMQFAQNIDGFRHKKLHKAFRTHTGLYAKPTSFNFHYLPNLYIGFKPHQWRRNRVGHVGSVAHPKLFESSHGPKPDPLLAGTFRIFAGALSLFCLSANK